MACDAIWVNGDRYNYERQSAEPIPFFYKNDELYMIMGLVGKTHGNLANQLINFKFKRTNFAQGLISFNNTGDENSPIMGRIFKKFKIITFWNYPTTQDFKKIINLLQTKKKIDMTDWKVEIYKGSLKKSKSNIEIIYPSSQEDYDENFELIPIEEYTGGGKIPKEYYLQHLQSPIQKIGNVRDRFPGYGHKKLAGQLPGEMEVAARARMYQEKLITKFESFDNRINLYHGTTTFNANLLLKFGWQPKNFKGGNMGDSSYLYLTSEPQDALWFGNENGGDTVVEVNDIPIKYLKPDPDDESGFDMNELLDRMKRGWLPSKFVLFEPLDSKHFKIKE